MVRIWPWNWKSNIFSQLHLQTQIFIFISCLKVWEWEKYWHMVLRCKRIHKPGRTFSGFSRIFMELCKSKVQLGPPHGSFINGVANPETIYYIPNCWSAFSQCFRKTTYIILRISWVYWENLAQARCFKVIVVNSESFCCCMQGDLHLISSPSKYTGRGITSSHFSVRH